MELNAPSAVHLEAIDQAIREIGQKGTPDSLIESLSRDIGIRAGMALAEILGDDAIRVTHSAIRKGTGGRRMEHALRADDTLMDGNSIRASNGSSSRLIAMIAVRIKQNRALIGYADARRRAGIASDGKGWRDGVLVHPCSFLFEEFRDRRHDAGQEEITTTKMLPKVSIAGTERPRKVSLIPGTPRYAWSDHRPTIIRVETCLPGYSDFCVENNT